MSMSLAEAVDRATRLMLQKKLYSESIHHTSGEREAILKDAEALQILRLHAMKTGPFKRCLPEGDPPSADRPPWKLPLRLTEYSDPDRIPRIDKKFYRVIDSNGHWITNWLSKEEAEFIAGLINDTYEHDFHEAEKEAVRKQAIANMMAGVVKSAHETELLRESLELARRMEEDRIMREMERDDERREEIALREREIKRQAEEARIRLYGVTGRLP